MSGRKEREKKLKINSKSNPSQNPSSWKNNPEQGIKFKT
jgi:hypothetical protein